MVIDMLDSLAFSIADVIYILYLLAAESTAESWWAMAPDPGTL
jgi:hypothetical protein